MLVHWKAEIIDDENPFTHINTYGISYGDTIADAVQRIIDEQFEETDIAALTVYPESDVISDFDYPEIKEIVKSCACPKLDE